MLFDNTFVEELKICAIAQGYGKDLKPLFKYPVITFEVYLDILNILENKTKQMVKGGKKDGDEE